MICFESLSFLHHGPLNKDQKESEKWRIKEHCTRILGLKDIMYLNLQINPK